MNHLITSASKAAALSLRTNYIAPATRLAAVRCFSSSDDEIKTGVIKYFSYTSNFGFILPDGVDKNTHDDKDLIFIHRNDIRKQSQSDGVKFYPPALKRNQRVAFKVSPPEGNAKCPKAYDLTMEDGTLIPPFSKGYLERYTKSQKAKFGDRIFEIMSTCTDQQDMETQIVAAFDEVKENIERQRLKMEKAGMLSDE